jgi:hypothetical protein
LKARTDGDRDGLAALGALLLEAPPASAQGVSPVALRENAQNGRTHLLAISRRCSAPDAA